ncbi:MAG: hypothetical protein LBV36_05380 [Chromatiales bacterium]|jgi:hypothetical protein|nr:hypothetical protein [Chromatiales bacterium]
MPEIRDIKPAELAWPTRPIDRVQPEAAQQEKKQSSREKAQRRESNDEVRDQADSADSEQSSGDGHIDEYA